MTKISSELQWGTRDAFPPLENENAQSGFRVNGLLRLKDWSLFTA